MKAKFVRENGVKAFESLEKKGIKITYDTMGDEIKALFGIRISMPTLAKFMKSIRSGNDYDIRRLQFDTSEFGNLPFLQAKVHLLEEKIYLLEKQVHELSQLINKPG